MLAASVVESLFQSAPLVGARGDIVVPSLPIWTSCFNPRLWLEPEATPSDGGHKVLSTCFNPRLWLEPEATAIKQLKARPALFQSAPLVGARGDSAARAGCAAR